MTEQTITWTCDECGEVVDRGSGHVVLYQDELPMFTAERRAQEERLRAEAALWGEDAPLELESKKLSEIPESTPWRVLHSMCDTDLVEEHVRPAYPIPVHEIATPALVAYWTVQLAGKSWYDDTDWDQFVQERVFRPLGITPPARP